MRKVLVVLLLYQVAALATAQIGHTVVIKGAKIYTLTGDVIEDGSLLIDSVEIAAIGTDIRVPSGAEAIDASGMVVTPRLTDFPFSPRPGPSGGVNEDNEMSQPATP
jgi:predicted amidohydrolase